MPSDPPARPRLVSLDQFRGYTVVGMVLVNFAGHYDITPYLLRHHNTFCSYADTIMPQFFFAVGFAFRLTFGQRSHDQGIARAYLHAARRILGLGLVAIVIEHVGRVPSWDALCEQGIGVLYGPATRGWYGPLLHIALTSLWVLPVIRAGKWVRVAWATGSAIAHFAICHWFYFSWVHDHGTDGGPLGFLTWSIPTIVGTLACDTITGAGGRSRVFSLAAWSAALMALGYLISCGTTLYDVPDERVDALRPHAMAADAVIPSSERLSDSSLSWSELPFIQPPPQDLRKHNYWMMSQRVATVSYHTFAAGFSLLVYLLFYLACDVYGWQLGVFRTFGSNALVSFIIHNFVGDAVEAYIPHDAPLWYVTLGFACDFGLIYLFVHHLEKNKIYLKL